MAATDSPAPEEPSPKITPARASRLTAAQLLQQARVLYSQGKLDEAELKLTQVLKANPTNQAAIYYLEKISEKKSKESASLASPQPVPLTNHLAAATSAPLTPAVSSEPAIPQQLVLETCFIEYDEDQAQALGIDWIVDEAINPEPIPGQKLTNQCAILTPAASREILRLASSGVAGVDRVTAPRVTILSDREVCVGVQDVIAVKTSDNRDTKIPVGPVLDALPTVRPDGLTIHLTAMPSLTIEIEKRHVPIQPEQDFVRCLGRPDGSHRRPGG